MSSVAQMLRQADALKATISDSSKTITETWGVRQKLEDLYKKVLLTDLEYALDKKVEQELWNHAFKNQITNLQAQAKDKQNVKRAELVASLNLFLETASGFYLQFLQLICSTFKLDLPFRRKASYYGIIREKTPLKLKVTPPKKSSCLYVCQHCLVHLGDIARYRQQIDQAQTYYWHAASLVPFNGQPYNQLAILEAAKGNKLSTVFYYIRSLAVKVPFPVAATNLEKLYLKLTKETPEFKGKLSASEMITGFLQFHALVHLCTDFDKAEDLSQKLAAGLPAHVTSQSFPWQVLVQIVAINIFSMHHLQHGVKPGLANGDAGLTEDEERCFDLVFTLTVLMLDILLQYTPRQENKLREYFTLPAIKLLLDWLKLNPHNFERPVLRASTLWANLCRVLNTIQSLQNQQVQEKEMDMSKYEDLPLPEDAELRCFQPIEKAQSCYSYSKLPASGIPVDVEVQLRCERLLTHGRWIMEEQPSVNLSAESGGSGQLQFISATPPPQPQPHATTTKTVTLSLPSTHIPTAASKMSVARSPERRSARQNVAIQAIMQKQAQDKDKPKKEDPTSPKYLLGVPTSEPPVFFKQGGGRQSQANSPLSQPSPAQKTAVNAGGQHGGVLVLKNQDHLIQSGKSVQQPKSQPWQPSPRQLPVSAWQPHNKHKQQQQQQQQMTESQGWSNTQVSPQSQQLNGPSHGQTLSWQQQQQHAIGMNSRPQLSPQSAQGQWQFPVQPGMGGGDFRARAPSGGPSMSHAPAPSPSTAGPHTQGSIYQQGPHNRSSFPQQNKPAGPGPSLGPPMYGKEGVYNNLNMNPGGNGLISNPTAGPQAAHSVNSGQHMKNSPAGEQFGPPSHISGDGPGGNIRPTAPTQMNMFRHPPPGTRFNQQGNFANNPHVDMSANQQPGLRPPQQHHQSATGNNVSPGNHGNFPHAPGTERVQGGRGSQKHQMNFQGNPFMNPFPGFMGFPGMSTNQMKSPLESLFGKPQYTQEDIPASMANLIGTLSKMAIQPPPTRDNMMLPTRSGPTTFQGHAEGTPKPESFFTQQRGSTVPSVSIDLESKSLDTLPAETSQPQLSPAVPPQHHQQQQQQPQQQQQQQGTYSLFSGSPWLSSGDSKSLGSSPFSSQSSSMRNSPDPSTDTFSGPESKLDMGLRYSTTPDDRTMKQMSGDHGQMPPGPFFQNNMQSLWPNPGQSPLERLLELQKQQRQTDPH